jgi:hypothetical protein
MLDSVAERDIDIIRQSLFDGIEFADRPLREILCEIFLEKILLFVSFLKNSKQKIFKFFYKIFLKCKKFLSVPFTTCPMNTVWLAVCTFCQCVKESILRL